ncbi:hypothetical protein EV586_10682 [Tumebacillus sp. BK434]|uniref:hypothetical protein n=1 Tax=Tumebacillus sp. BK434 TaxID=2512169 RepID=UPI001051F28D|nr:hypothetical protein [Tumebacillus sp. BK434]TCP53348.1 hypothetical protein EV586_10682 [Tumebacillus sp. BK434]
MNKNWLFWLALPLLLTGCAEQATGEAIRPLVEKHLPDQVELQTLLLQEKNLELSFDQDAAKLSHEAEGQLIKNIHDELLRTFGHDQVTSVTYRIEQQTARTINGLSCKRATGCWTPFLSLPSGDDPFANRGVSIKNFEELIAASDLIVIANFADGAYRAGEVLKGNPAVKGKTLQIHHDLSRDFAGPGRYLLFLETMDREPGYMITGVWSGKFKLEGRPKGYGQDQVRSLAEQLTDQALIELIKQKT